MEKNWYAPGEVKVRQMTDEEKQQYQRRLKYPWDTRQTDYDINCRIQGRHHVSSMFKWQRFKR